MAGGANPFILGIQHGIQLNAQRQRQRLANASENRQQTLFDQMQTDRKEERQAPAQFLASLDQAKETRIPYWEGMNPSAAETLRETAQPVRIEQFLHNMVNSIAKNPAGTKGILTIAGLDPAYQKYLSEKAKEAKVADITATESAKLPYQQILEQTRQEGQNKRTQMRETGANRRTIFNALTKGGGSTQKDAAKMNLYKNLLKRGFSDQDAKDIAFSSPGMSDKAFWDMAYQKVLGNSDNDTTLAKQKADQALRDRRSGQDDLNNGSIFGGGMDPNVAKEMLRNRGYNIP